MQQSSDAEDGLVREQEGRLRRWFIRDCDPVRAEVDGLDIGWGGVQPWATRCMPQVAGMHLDVACGYATFLAQLAWRFPGARLVGLNLDFEGPHALARRLLEHAGVAASLVQADAQRMPFASGSLASLSCFLGLQDIEIGFGLEGVHRTLSEMARVLCPGGVLTLIDEFPFERFDMLLRGFPLCCVVRAECRVEVRWERPVAERAIALYAEGWASQVRSVDSAARDQARRDAYSRMAAEMERQLGEQGFFVPFGPERMVVARKADSDI